MNRKLKKMIAVVSAVATCTVSMVSMTSGALYIYNTAGVTPYTVSFTMNNVKYGAWQEMNDYFNNDENRRFFISEDGERDIALIDGYITSWGWHGYHFSNDDEGISVLEKYLSDNNIEYYKGIGDGTVITVPRLIVAESYEDEDGILVEEYETLYTSDEYFELLQDIKKETGFIQRLIMQASAMSIEVADVENTIPEPTLIGDTNCDGEVNISDAVLIMQSISNPSEYQISLQGIANADVTGDDGITLLDALRIQEMQVGR